MTARPHSRLRCALCAVLLSALGSTLGCTQDTSEQLKEAIEGELRERLAKEKEEGAAAAEGSSAQPELLANKLNLYLDCGRVSQAPVRESYRSYRQWIGAGGELRLAAAPVSLVSDRALASCDSAAKSGRHLQPPQPELEAATLVYVDALRSYATRLEEVAGILETAARGKKVDPVAALTIRELAPSLDAAYNAWEEASKGLTEQINDTQARVDKAVLDRIEQRAGRGAEFHTRAFVIASRPLVRCLTSEPGVACESAFFALEQAHGELHGYLEVHASEAAKVFWIDQFVASADQYYEVARALLDKVRAGGIGADEVGAVVDEFNDLLREAGNLNFTRLEDH